MYLSHLQMANLFGAGFAVGIAVYCFTRKHDFAGIFMTLTAVLNLMAVFG